MSNPTNPTNPTNSPDAPDVSPVLALIEQTRKLLRSTWIATGMGVALGLFLAAVFVVTLTDLALAWSPLFRFIGFLLVVGPAGWVFYIGVVRPWRRRLSEVSVARHIEREMPGIHNRLVSCVDLADGKAQTQSDTFHRRLVSEAVERIRTFEPRQVLDMPSLKRAGMFASATLLAMLLVTIIFSGRITTAMARFALPFGDIPPASGVMYDVLVNDQTEPDDYTALRGADIDVNVIMIKGEVDTPGGHDPLRLEIETVDEGGDAKTLWYNFPELADSRTTFRLSGLQETFEFRVHGGGTWSRTCHVTMLDRPRVIGLRTVLNYPPYMNVEPRAGLPQAVDVTGPVDSRVDLFVDIDGIASEGEIQFLRPSTKTIKLKERPTRTWYNDTPPHGATWEGHWQWHPDLFDGNGHSVMPFAGPHSHGFHSDPIGCPVEPGDILFADVFLAANVMPEAIMLEWHDGTSWEHRAYWGADLIDRGQPGTSGRRHMGDLPTTSGVVRLQVPADKLKLGGRRLTGMRFTIYGERSGVQYDVHTLAAPYAGYRVEYFDDNGLLFEELQIGVSGSFSFFKLEQTGQDNFQIDEYGQIHQQMRSYGDNYIPGVWELVAESAVHPTEGIQAFPGPIFPAESSPSLCVWGSVGVIPATERQIHELAVVETFPLSRDGASKDTPDATQWSGSFPLQQNGYYRVELRNAAGNPSQNMQEGQITAVPDNAPQLLIEKPGTDLVVTSTAKVSVHISAYDDFGIEEIIMLLRRGDGKTTEERSVKTFDPPQRSEAMAVTLDLATDIEDGNTLQFRCRVRDTKGQLTTTPLHTIRVATARHTADRKFDAFERKTDTFKESLVQLLGRQVDVHRSISHISETYAGLQVEIRQIRLAAEAAGETNWMARLSPESLDRLERLRAELTGVATQHTGNLALSREVAAALKELAQDSDVVDLLSPKIAAHLKSVNKVFKEMVIGPMEKLEGKLHGPESEPNLKTLERESEDVKDNLATLDTRIEIVAAAQSASRSDLEEALSDLREGVARQDAGDTARRLEELNEFMEALATDLKILKGAQEKLLDKTKPNTGDQADPGMDKNKLDAIASDQDALEAAAEKKLDEAQGILDAGRVGPAFPERPYTPDQQDSAIAAPDEQDTPGDGKEESSDSENEPENLDDEPEIFIPALGGPAPELDSRFEEETRDVDNPDKEKTELDELRERQVEQALELDAAQKAIKADQEVIEAMLDKLNEAAKADLTPEETAALEEHLISDNISKAEGMAEEAEQIVAGEEDGAEGEDNDSDADTADESHAGQSETTADAMVIPNPEMTAEEVKEVFEVFPNLNLSARTRIMRMQPKQREEMLLGLRDEGPVGYRKFIRDYFRRLTEAQAKN
jgi:hypothetical protein